VRKGEDEGIKEGGQNPIPTIEEDQVRPYLVWGASSLSYTMLQS